jgi:NADP-dependent 3-hydroxy acid dehydrogenase YdfG
MSSDVGRRDQRRVFLVTGASGTIGAAAARAAAAAGFDLVLSGRRVDLLESLAEELRATVRAIAVAADVTEWADLQSLVSRTVAEYGRLDVALVNAGQSSHCSFLDGDDTHEEWRQMVLTNVYGTAATAKALLPLLVGSRGHLVLMGSVAGRVPVPGSLYSATKWAVTAMGQSIRAEANGTGIRVTVVEPGLVDTPAISPDRRDQPKLRPQDVAAAVVYAVNQPPSVDVNEIVVRPVGQSPYR